jgi:DNA-binding NarL/FixJ family response regulator
VVTCVVADAHPAILDSVSHLLEQAGGFEVVGVAARGNEALALVRELEPDLALVDASLPDLDTLELVRRIGSGTRIVVYSGDNDPVHARAALAAGAAAYVLKAGSLDQLRRAVQAAAAGQTFVDPQLERRRTDRPELTVRERQVLALLAEGLANDEIAGQLAISSPTVRTHTKNAMEKLQASTRTEAVATALRRSLI